MEHDAPPVLGDVPARGERRLERERRVVGRERLVQLGGDRCRCRVGLGRAGRTCSAPGRGCGLRRGPRPRPAQRPAKEQDRGDDGERGQDRAGETPARRGVGSGAPPVERSGEASPLAQRVEATLDRDGDAGPGRPGVAVARQPEQQGDDAGPLTHGGSMRQRRRAPARDTGRPRARIAGGTMRSARPRWR